MLDLCLKWTVAAIVAGLITRRAGPANAASAHRVWLCVLLMPALWAVGEWLFDAAVLVQFRRTPVIGLAAELGTRLAAPLLVVYAAVAVALLARVAVGAARVRQVRRCSRALSRRERARVESISRGLADAVRHGAHPLPVTAGFLRPVVLLPPGWQSLREYHLGAILLHEAAHARRKDPLIALLAAVVEAIFWFHPAAWVAGSRVRWFAEMACDASAGASCGERRYASALLELASGWRETREPGHPLLASAGTRVGRRLHLLLDELERGASRSMALRAGAVVLLLCALASACIESGRLSHRVGIGHPSDSHARHVHP